MPFVKVRYFVVPSHRLAYTFLQAMDLRALQFDLSSGIAAIAREEMTHAFGSTLSPSQLTNASVSALRVMLETLETTSTMDAIERMHKVAASTTAPLLDFFTSQSFVDHVNPLAVGAALTNIAGFRTKLAQKMTDLLEGLRIDYLTGAKGAAPASRFLNKTKPIYEFVRLTLGIRMHGAENLTRCENGLGVDDVSIGQNVSLIHEVCLSFREIRSSC